jgi:hypothetical protein
MRQVNVNVLSAVDTASHNGAQIDSNQLYNISFQAVFGDTSAAGTFFIQGSNDVCPVGQGAQLFVVTNWTNIPNATSTITAGASALILIAPTCYRWLRAVYTRSSGGSSTINVNMFAQGV